MLPAAPARQRIEPPLPAEESLMTAVDNGGLLYLYNQLNTLVTSLENTFTHCFGLKLVRSDSLMNLVSFLQLTKLNFLAALNTRQQLQNHKVLCDYKDPFLRQVPKHEMERNAEANENAQTAPSALNSALRTLQQLFLFSM